MRKKPSLWELSISILGAFFGVQSSEVHERDSVSGHDWRVYALVAVVFTIIFVAIIMKVVHYILVNYHY